MVTSATFSGSSNGAASAGPRLQMANYLAATVGACCLASSADAAIVVIDLKNAGSPAVDITGVNGGNPDGTDVNNFVGGTKLEIYSTGATYSQFGVDGDNGLSFAVTGGKARPKNFSSGNSIGASEDFSGGAAYTVFKVNYYGSGTSPDFGPNSFLGFRADVGGGNYLYGWIEATWNSSTEQFRLISAAYENTPNTAIAAGDTGSVPEPGSLALVSLTLGGVAFSQWRRRRLEKRAQQANADSGLALAA